MAHRISVALLAGSRRRRRDRKQDRRLEGWTWVDVEVGFAAWEVGKALVPAAALVRD